LCHDEDAADQCRHRQQLVKISRQQEAREPERLDDSDGSCPATIELVDQIEQSEQDEQCGTHEGDSAEQAAADVAREQTHGRPRKRENMPVCHASSARMTAPNATWTRMKPGSGASLPCATQALVMLSALL